MSMGGSKHNGIGELIPYGAGTVYNTDTGRYEIVGQPGSYAESHALQEALYAPIAQALQAQTPEPQGVMIGPYSTVPEQRFYTLPNGAQVSEAIYLQAVAEGRVPELIHEYTGYGGALVASGYTGVLPGGGAAVSVPAIGTGGAAVIPKVSLQNLTTGNASLFYVGDRFRITITGPAGAEVKGSAVQDGRGLGTTPYGAVSSSGLFTLEGTFGAEHLGSWVESWTVGGVEAEPHVLMFVCQAKPAGAGAGQVATAAPGTTAGATEAQRAAGFDFMGLLTDKAIGGIPNWVLLAGVGGGLLLLKGR